MSVERVFKMTDPQGVAFYAAVVNAGGGLRVVTNRGGVWAGESRINVADLVMPEQRLGEWDVYELKESDWRPVLKASGTSLTSSPK